MNDLNSVYLVGRILKDVKLTGKQAEFSICNNQFRYNEKKKSYDQQTLFFDIVADLSGEVQYPKILKKGTRVGINGRLLKTVRDKIVIVSYNFILLDKVEEK